MPNPNNRKNEQPFASELITANKLLLSQNEAKDKVAAELQTTNNALKKAEEKITKAMHLYAFISQVNQKIVRVNDQESLFRNACRIALEFGKFKMAWIGLFDFEQQTISVVEQSGIPEEEMQLFHHIKYGERGPQDYVLKTGTYYICNDIPNELELESWKPFAARNNILSCMVLPIQKAGKIIGTFNLYSRDLDFSYQEEMSILIELSEDISFALDLFEKTKKQKETEELVIQNEKRFRKLIEKSADMITLSNEQGAMLYGSPSISSLLGYSAQEIPNTVGFDFIHPDDLSGFIEKRKKIIAVPGSSFTHQLRLHHKNGNWVWCECDVTNLLHDPSIQAILGNFRDISDNKDKEEQLRKSEAFSGEILNALSSHIAVVDAEGKVVSVNEAWNRFALENGTHSLLATGLGSNYFEVTALAAQRGDKLAVEALNGIMEVLHGQTPFFYLEYPCHSPEKERWFAMRVKRIQGDRPLVVVSHSEISERKLAQDQLVHQNQELQKANAELDSFVYSVSHDLRSPLTSVLGLLYFIEKESKEPDTLKYASMIRSSITRLDAFIKNILIYSKNNRTELDVKEIPVGKKVIEVVEILRNMKDAEGITIDVHIDETKPFFSDEHRFDTILENIISNAIKYHKKDDTNRFIHISGESDEKELRLYIEDNGIGISKDHSDKIFDMFFRISNTTPGSGVGLYIVREIVEKLQGTIRVKSEEGIGSTFVITLKNLK